MSDDANRPEADAVIFCEVCELNAKLNDVKIVLAKNETIVLFEFLQRFSDTDELKIVDTAEEQVLWKLCGILEKQLSEPFDIGYLEILEAARRELRGE
ncbi:hypothetical protein ACEN9F_27195 [Duganella sp. CT11-25]|uniref:hypothetical protein n=1 Tax=unclassified Duganella TaxID=2636909 RepID=UPI0039AF0B27